MDVLNIVFSALNPSGYSDRWCHSGDLDDLAGCLSGASRAQNIIPKAKKIDRLCSPTERSIFLT